MKPFRTMLSWVFAGCVLFGSVSCISTSRTAADASLEPRFFLEHAHHSPQRQDYKAVLPVSRSEINLLPFPAFDLNDIGNVEVVELPMGRALAFHFRAEAAKHLMSTSATATGRRLVLALGDRFVGARRFEGALTDGMLILFVELPDEKLEHIARSINARVENG